MAVFEMCCFELAQEGGVQVRAGGLRCSPCSTALQFSNCTMKVFHWEEGLAAFALRDLKPTGLWNSVPHSRMRPCMPQLASTAAAGTKRALCAQLTFNPNAMPCLQVVAKAMRLGHAAVPRFQVRSRGLEGSGGRSMCPACRTQHCMCGFGICCEDKVFMDWTVACGFARLGRYGCWLGTSPRTPLLYCRFARVFSMHAMFRQVPLRGPAVPTPAGAERQLAHCLHASQPGLPAGHAVQGRPPW